MKAYFGVGGGGRRDVPANGVDAPRLPSPRVTVAQTSTPPLTVNSLAANRFGSCRSHHIYFIENAIMMSFYFFSTANARTACWLFVPEGYLRDALLLIV